MPAFTVTRLVPLVLLACLAWLPPALAFAVEATINVDVLGGKWKGVRLKSLPRGASVALRIESSDALRVIVVDSSELRRFPNTRPLFEASMEKRLGFSVVIPRSGDYYVIFDNRKSTEPRQVKFNVKADTPARSPPPAGKPKKREETRLDFMSRRHA
jgi:hypothetical protein